VVYIETLAGQDDALEAISWVKVLWPDSGTQEDREPSGDGTRELNTRCKESMNREPTSKKVLCVRP
jgi:hypothetical protein